MKRWRNALAAARHHLPDHRVGGQCRSCQAWLSAGDNWAELFLNFLDTNSSQSLAPPDSSLLPQAPPGVASKPLGMAQKPKPNTTFYPPTYHHTKAIDLGPTLAEFTSLLRTDIGLKTAAGCGIALIMLYYFIYNKESIIQLSSFS